MKNTAADKTDRTAGSVSSSEYQEGYAAGMTPDIYSEHNPYRRRSIKARDWEKGWMDGAERYIEAMSNVRFTEDAT